ncbi:MAG: hypothetical protein M0P57_07050 [Syntrophales bacterium]|jgi:hypothetical protein|nr:hypothetical protein [Syntrophales bacterium]MDY0045516.1 hypothetical protein [Syntrophales bacterium]
MRRRYFKIKSKYDASLLAKEIRKTKKRLCFEKILFDESEIQISLEWNEQRNIYIVSTFGHGWTNRSEITQNGIIDFLWRDRKFINASFGEDFNVYETIAVL